MLSLAALKLILVWFVMLFVIRSNMIKKLFTALYADESILYFTEHPGNVIFPCNEMGILNIDLNNVSLDNNLDEDDSKLLFLSHFWLGILKLKNAKHLKKISEKLMAIAQDPERWWNFCVSEDEKKEVEPIFTEGL